MVCRRTYSAMWLQLIFLGLSGALTAVACALLWSSVHDDYDIDNVVNDSGNYETASFILILILCAAAVYVRHRSANFFIVGAGGLLLFLILQSRLVSWSVLNQARLRLDNDTPPLSTEQRKGLQRQAVGGAFAFIAAFAQIAITAPFWSINLKSSVAAKIVLMLIATVAAVIGTITLWTVEGAGSDSIQANTVWTVAPVTCFTMIFAWIGVLTDNNQIAIVAFLGWAIRGWFFLSDLFIAQIFDSPDEDQLISGTVFCWAAVCLCVIPCLLVNADQPKKRGDVDVSCAVTLAIDGVIMFLALALVWSGISTYYEQDLITVKTRHLYVFDAMGFALLWFTLFSSVVVSRDARAFFLLGAAGLWIYLTSDSIFTSWYNINELRDQDTGTLSSDLKKAHDRITAGLGLAHFAAALGMLFALPIWKIDVEHNKAVKVISMLVATVLALVGTATIWTVDRIDTQPQWLIATTTCLAVYFGWLGVLGNAASLATASMFLTGYHGWEILSFAMTDHAQPQNDNENQFMAGSVFCWAACLVTVIAGIFANHDADTTDASGKENPNSSKADILANKRQHSNV
eukprot:m.17851 g.17851  ORF g.17851 m.17851 type:complete len:573 (+) comp3621_c0_seq2:202-1920(+)